jgi:probable rRNA maturation factor
MEPASSEDPAWYHNRQRKIRIDDRQVSAFVRRLGRDLARGRAFAVVVSSDRFVRNTNGRFRGKPAVTDVLSFPDGEDRRLGDILIAAGQARRQARALGHRVEDEVKVLALHGLLHLLGYDHERDEGRMRRAERRWRRVYGLTAGLIERAEP